MVRFLLRAVLLLFALGFAHSAEVTVELPEHLVPGAVMQGQVIITDPATAVTRVDLPAVNGLTWELQGQTQSTTMINGLVTRRDIRGLALRADQAGELQLPAITVHLRDGSTLTTAPRALSVHAADPALTGDGAAEASFAPSTIVPGEPTTLTFRLALREGTVRTLGVAPPTGTVVLGERTDEKSSTIGADGQQWTVFLFHWRLTATAPGVLTVSGQQEVLQQIGGSFFDDRVSRRQIPIKPATLTIASLPSVGRPADFTGLIGPVTVSAQLDRARISAGEGARYSVTVHGQQVDLLRPPALALPANVQVYAKDAETLPDGRRFAWDLAPSAPGQVTLPAIAFSFFDPETRAYRRAETPTLTLTVVPGRAASLSITGATAPTPDVSNTPAISPPSAVLLPLEEIGFELSARQQLIAGGATFVVALLAAVAWPRRGRRPSVHRGRALAQAVRANDLDAIARALQALTPVLSDPAACDEGQRAAAAALARAVDAARFGGQHIGKGSLRPLASVLESLP